MSRATALDLPDPAPGLRDLGGALTVEERPGRGAVVGRVVEHPRGGPPRGGGLPQPVDVGARPGPALEVVDHEVPAVGHAAVVGTERAGRAAGRDIARLAGAAGVRGAAGVAAQVAAGVGVAVVGARGGGGARQAAPGGGEVGDGGDGVAGGGVVVVDPVLRRLVVTSHAAVAAEVAHEVVEGGGDGGVGGEQRVGGGVVAAGVDIETDVHDRLPQVLVLASAAEL